jgi:methanethiol oxidase
MKRREFLTTVATATASTLFAKGLLAEDEHQHEHHSCGLTYASPGAAMHAPREKLAYAPCIYASTGIEKPDYLATVDVDPASQTYGRVIHRLEMPNTGDELHHYGWNACSSCHGDPLVKRRYLVLPGLTSSRIHILDTSEPSAPRLHKVIEPEEVFQKADLSAPHTVHCRADGKIMISMLGNSRGEGPGGFLLLDQDFRIAGHWEKSTDGMEFNYDFWYQPRHNVMVSSEWGAPNTIKSGFNPEDVKAGKYGRHLRFWDWESRRLVQSADLGEQGWMPLEVRFHHNPDSTHGFAGAALGSSIWHWCRDAQRWKVEKVVQVDPVVKEGRPSPVPGLVTDVVLSLDDRWLYFSNWLHGDVRQYDVRDPARPKLTGRLWLGGVLGKGREVRGKKLPGGPQMLQLSLDGKRLYITSSLYSSWDNQFYPEIAQKGSYLLQADCNTDQGGLTLNERFLVDFGTEPNGPARAHEIRFPNGDCTSDIWV